MSRVLIVGTPRSGTTWTAEVLARARGAHLVHEPDNAVANPAAAALMRARGMYAVITAGESAPDYKTLWDHAFAGGWPVPVRMAGRRLHSVAPRTAEATLRRFAPVVTRARRRPANPIVKSVYAAFAIDWIVATYNPKVVLVERDPMSVVASWLKLGLSLSDLDEDERTLAVATALGAPPPMPRGARHVRAAWCVAFLSTVLRSSMLRHGNWIVVNHGSLVSNTFPAFHGLFADLALQWTSRVDAYISASDRPGGGYERSRVRSELADTSHSSLPAAQAADIAQVLASFPTLKAAS